MKSGWCLFGGLFIVAQLQLPGCLTQDKQKRKANIPKYIYCAPQTSVVSCPQQDEYMNITGACNNRNRPHLGVSETAFARWLPAEYEDGISLPTGWTEGKLHHGHPLPQVREISNIIICPLHGTESADEERSQIFMEWGQWITHDMIFSPLAILNCSNPSPCGNLCVNGEPENCFPVKIPPSDPRTEQRGRCLTFFRSVPACSSETDVREPINEATSFLDASALYGSQECRSNMLKNRTSELGLMAVNQHYIDGSHAFLPFDDEVVDLCPPSVFCIPKDPCALVNTTYNIPCFAAGDKRSNQNVLYLTLNTLFLREHNRLARELKKLNPHWNGERVYLETRRIMGASMQVITYKDYLPLVLGDWTELELPPYSQYNEDVDPRIAVVFSIALRFAHAAIPTHIFRLNSQYQPFHPFFQTPFHQVFFATYKIVKEGGLDPWLRGLLVNGAKLMKHSAMMSEEVREKLFKITKDPGLDLAAIDLQRERDFGLPKYNTWRRFCGLTAPRDMDELTAVFKSKQLATKLLDLYKTTENIDMWIGGTAEPFVKNGRVGPLFACLIGSQFRKIRDGDRYWWQNPGVFTPKQLSALSIISLSRIICDNSGLNEVPRNVFKDSEYPEDFVTCNAINKLDLSAWIEVKGQKEKHTEL
ncbi:lactoperoxidase-like [Ambystoma mexicanum]|uniref:lactoperoxidase-like n=1 Tax=Ambystoma mexicanum TaxID=8296 RepID=UPI0037E948D6